MRRISNNQKCLLSVARGRQDPYRIRRVTLVGDPCVHARRGSLMIEMVVCCVLLSVVTSILVPGIYAVHQQRKATRYDALTLIELNNLAGRAIENDVSSLKLSDWFSDRYRAAQLSVTPVEIDDTAAADKLLAYRLEIVKTSEDAVPDIKRSVVIWKTAPTNAAQEDSE